MEYAYDDSNTNDAFITSQSTNEREVVSLRNDFDFDFFLISIS